MTQPFRRHGFTTFPEAPTSEPGVVAVLITKDPDTNELKPYVHMYEGFQMPDPEIIGALVTAAEIAQFRGPSDLVQNLDGEE